MGHTEDQVFGGLPEGLPLLLLLNDRRAVVEKMQSEVIDSALEASAYSDDVTIRRTLEKGRPADTLMAVAEGADMLVVGNRGRGGFAGLRRGSVSQAIAHHSPCPLVIVRTGLADD